MDDAHSIVEGALGHHIRMINEFKGVPGVMPERLAEGMQVVLQHMPALLLDTLPTVYRPLTVPVSGAKSRSTQCQPGILNSAQAIPVSLSIYFSYASGVGPSTLSVHATAKALRAVAGGRANHVPRDQLPGAEAAHAPHLHLSGH